MSTKANDFALKVKEVYRNELIEEISNLVLNSKIEDLKMTDIADYLEIGVATLYRHFKTKKNIIIDCGIHLWKREIKLFEYVFENDLYEKKSGLEQINDLLKVYKVLYTGHSNFLKFLSQFDAYCHRENIDMKQLEEYEKNILDLYPLFEKAFSKGINDGSIKCKENVQVLYFTINHSLMALSQKLLPDGALLSSDDLIGGEVQIECMLNIIMEYIRGQENEKSNK